jgi:putative lipase involved disintegration of autophagic bodies
MKMDFSKLQITFKFRLEELENMIEVYTRQPHDSPLEDGIRKDLRNIRMKVEERINVEKKRTAEIPSEEEYLTSVNPTSVEHIK